MPGIDPTSLARDRHHRLVILAAGSAAAALLLVAAALAAAVAGRRGQEPPPADANPPVAVNPLPAPAPAPVAPPAPAPVPPAAPAGHPADDWTHAELLAYANARGAGWELSNVGAVYFHAPGKDIKGWAANSPPGGASVHFGFPTAVYAAKFKTAQEAREEAGSDPAVCHSWGRWYFRCPEAAELAKVRGVFR